MQAEHRDPAHPRSASGRPSLIAGLEAGALAGAVFLLLEYVSALLLGAASPLGPASITLRRLFNLEPEAVMQEYFIAVLFVHFTFSVLTTLVLGYAIQRTIRYWAVTFGVLYGLLLYAINFFVFALFLPDITAASDIFMMTNYMIYGGLAAWIYKWRLARRLTRSR